MSQYERIGAAIAASDFAELVAAVPYAQYLGVEIEAAGETRCYRLPYRDDLIGNATIQALHGGALAGFLECATLFEVLISQSQARIPRVIDLGVDYLRPARAQACVAACRVLRLGGRVAQVQAEAWQVERERPVAFVRADFLLQQP